MVTKLKLYGYRMVWAIFWSEELNKLHHYSLSKSIFNADMHGRLEIFGSKKEAEKYFKENGYGSGYEIHQMRIGFFY